MMHITKNYNLQERELLTWKYFIKYVSHHRHNYYS